ncbi:MAG: hypothetical protein KA953_05760 [Lachnospiraceae bacterium]|nr:hypothetical protein [Lachnospiraceae bacterium]
MNMEQATNKHSYIVSNQQLVEVEPTSLSTQVLSIMIVSQDILEEQDWAARYFEQKRNHRPLKEIRYCKLEIHEDAILGTMRIPNKEDYDQHIRFALYMTENRLVFIDDSKFVQTILERIYLGRFQSEINLSMILEEFLLQIVEGDQHFLASLEKKIETLEEEIISQEDKDYHLEILTLKKEISRMNRYYHQLFDMVDDLQSYSQDNHPLTYHIFENKINRLLQETIDLREYAMQVQDVYMSEIGIRQNNVMKMLTVVTTIFLPLTLLVGWYGMNFANMPELTWKYGYLGVALISIVIIVLTLWIMKRKKWM